MTRFALPLAAALLLAGCAQTYVSPVSVTRFLGDQPARLGQGPIAVRAAPGTPGNSLEFMPYRQAVAGELTRLGYRVVPGDAAAQVAEVRVARVVDQPGGRRNPVSVGVGGATGSYGSGLGLGVGIRFIHHALFEGTMFSLHYYIVDTIVLMILGFLGYQYTRTNQMVTQYNWLYERASLLSWKPKG